MLERLCDDEVRSESANRRAATPPEADAMFTSLSFVRRYGLDACGESCMRFGINGPVLDFGARRIFLKKIVALPVPRRPDWSGNKATTAVRADVVKHLVNTRGAKRALIAANACFRRVGRQCLVAVLAGWSKIKHATAPFRDPFAHRVQRVVGRSLRAAFRTERNDDLKASSSLRRQSRPFGRALP